MLGEQISVDKYILIMTVFYIWIICFDGNTQVNKVPAIEYRMERKERRILQCAKIFLANLSYQF